jgi:methionyl-tRNA formyltransferase
MTSRRLRTVFFGTAEFAVPALMALLEAGHEVLAVVTQPDKPQGRGMQMAASPVKRAAERHDLPVLQPRRVRAASFIAKMRELAPDVLTLAAFGQIVPQELLDLPPLGPINVHGSLLPKYRGAAPIQRAIMAGETETGVTTMWMDATLDTGDMLLARAIPIEPDDTAGALFPKLATLGAELLIETLAGLAAGTLPRRPQDPAQATFAPALTPEDALLHWNESARALHNRIRGVSPKPGAFAEIAGRRVKIWASQVAPAPTESALPGTLLGFSKHPAGVLVAAGEGTTLLLTETQPDSGKRMPADAWARGLRLTPGAQFV